MPESDPNMQEMESSPALRVILARMDGGIRGLRISVLRDIFTFHPDGTRNADETIPPQTFDVVTGLETSADAYLVALRHKDSSGERRLLLETDDMSNIEKLTDAVHKALQRKGSAYLLGITVLTGAGFLTHQIVKHKRAKDAS